jgi:glutamine synthetase
LAAAALLACGLDGVERGLDPGEPTTELNLHELSESERANRGIELLPGNLLDATRELERDSVLRAALGSCAREDYIDYFVKVKQREFQHAHDQISQWELDHYLQLY